MIFNSVIGEYAFPWAEGGVPRIAARRPDGPVAMLETAATLFFATYFVAGVLSSAFAIRGSRGRSYARLATTELIDGRQRPELWLSFNMHSSCASCTFDGAHSVNNRFIHPSFWCAD